MTAHHELALSWANELEETTISHRRALHKIPELGEELPQTTAYIAETLDALGISYYRTSNGGIVSQVDGKAGEGVLAIRADMDALPIKEETGLPFASTTGNMHACGHDAHAAILLATLEALSKHQTEWSGRVIGLFQPAEETWGGAEKMIHEGALDKVPVDAVIGLHIGSIFPTVGSGTIGIRRGPMMASVDTFAVEVTGRGGHGARPHECRDPVVAMSEMILSLQQVVSRNISPIESAVITIGLANAGNAVNVIPEKANFGATVRTLDENVRKLIEKRVSVVVKGIAQAHDLKAEVEYKHHYPSLQNDPSVTQFVEEQALSLFGAEAVTHVESPSMGAEDFSFFTQARPGCMFILGSWKKATDGQFYPHHNPRFDVNEDDFKRGVAMFLSCVLNFSDYVKTKKS